MTDALLRAYHALPSELRWLALYVLATALWNLLFSRFTDEQLATAAGKWWLLAQLIVAGRRLGLDPYSYLVAGISKVRALVKKAKGDDDGPRGGTPMTPAPDRQAAPPPPPKDVQHRLGLLCAAALLMALLAPGCTRNPNAQTPSLDYAAAGVMWGAKIVANADSKCAKAVDNLGARGEDAAALQLAERCTKSLKLAAQSLEVAADSINLGKATVQRDAMCAAMLTFQVVSGLAPILKQFGADLGPETDRFLGFAAPFADMGERLMCDDVKKEDGGV